MKEIWKDIEDYEGIYQVSNFGRIKNRFNKIIKPRIYENKYLYVILYNRFGYKNFRVHRLVAISFLENPLNLPYVNHKDGNKLNNNLNNLEWVTPLENIRHSINVLGKTNSKPVICQETKQKFNSIKEGASYYNLDASSLAKHLKGKNKTFAGYHWQYVI